MLVALEAACLTSQAGGRRRRDRDGGNEAILHALRRCAARSARETLVRRRACSRLRHGAIRLQCVTTQHAPLFPRVSEAIHTLLLHPRPLDRHGGRHRLAHKSFSVCARGSSSQHHLGRARVEGRPGIGALDCLTELDAPFPDGWLPPFPIGFAFFCLSLLSLHSLALARRGQRALSLEPGEDQWLLRHLLFEKVLMLLRLSARAQRAGSAVEARVWTCMRCCCAV